MSRILKREKIKIEEIDDNSESDENINFDQLTARRKKIDPGAEDDFFEDIRYP